MEVLIVHNNYKSSSPSGEDLVFRLEKELITANGSYVITYEKYNDDIISFPQHKKFVLPLHLLWSRETYDKLRLLIKKQRPDIAHFHNIWYLISPSAYYACQDAGVPVVQTLHNFRFFCSNGLLMKNGRICEKCVGRLPWRAVAHGCYRGSSIYSMPIALMEIFHRFLGTWKNKVDGFIALTEFSKKKFVECGLPEERIFVKPNFLPNPPKPSSSANDYTVFLGRLSFEKGLDTLIDASKILFSQTLWNFSLKIIGTGPLRRQIEDKVKTQKIQNIETIGEKTFEECIQLLKRARFLVMPSICYEGFPMVLIEAFACGKPVIASRLGALAELVEDGRTGLLFEPGNPKDLAEKVRWLWSRPNEAKRMGKEARKEYEKKYTADRNYEMLIEIYRRAILLNKERNQ